MNKKPDINNLLILSESDEEEEDEDEEGDDDNNHPYEDDSEEEENNIIQRSPIKKGFNPTAEGIEQDEILTISAQDSQNRDFMQNNYFDRTETVETEEDEHEDLKMFSAANFFDVNTIKEEAEGDESEEHHSGEDSSVSGSEAEHSDEKSGNEQKNDSELDEDEQEAILIANKVAESQEKMVHECATRMMFYCLKSKVVRVKREIFRVIYQFGGHKDEDGSDEITKDESVLNEKKDEEVGNEKKQEVGDLPNRAGERHDKDEVRRENSLRACRKMVREYRLILNNRLRKVLLHWHFAAHSLSVLKNSQEKTKKLEEAAVALKSKLDEAKKESEKREGVNQSGSSKVNEEQSSKLAVPLLLPEQEKLSQSKPESSTINTENKNVLPPPLLLSNQQQKEKPTTSNTLPPPLLLPGQQQAQTQIENKNTLPPPLLLPGQQAQNNGGLKPPLLLPGQNSNILPPPNLLGTGGGLQPPNLLGGGLLPPNLLGGGGLQPPNLLGGGLQPPNLLGGGGPQPPNLLGGGGLPPPNLLGGGLQAPNLLGGGGLPPPNLLGGGLQPPNLLGGGGLPPPNLLGGGGLPPPNLLGGGGFPAPNLLGGGLPPPNLMGGKGLAPPLLGFSAGIQNVVQQAPKRTPPQTLQGKKIHFNAITKFKLATTFWGKPTPHDSRLKPLEVDYEKLEQKFFEVKKTEDPNKNANVQGKAPQFTIMDPNKLNNTNIVLTSFTQPLDDVVDILIKCGDDFTVEQLSKLVTLIPNDEDRKKLIEYKDDLNKLMKVERFLKKFIEIPRLKQRLDSMIFQKNYASDYEDFKQKTEETHEPFLILKSCPKFDYTLKFILDILNYLNHGTNKANQFGFTLDALNALESAKSFDKSTTMLMFVVENIRNIDPTYLSFIEDFKCFNKGCSMEVGDLEKKFKDLEDGISKIETEMEEMRKLGESLNGKEGEEVKKQAFECFNASFPPFVTESKQKNALLTKKLQQLKDDVKIVGDTYGENKEYKTKDFLNILINFANNVKATIQKIEDKKAQEAKNVAKELNKPRSKSLLEPTPLPSKLAIKKKESKEKKKDHHMERPTFKERVTVTMRQTIRQLKKNLHAQKEPPAEKTQPKKSEFKPDHKPLILKMDVGPSVIKKSGLISFK